MRLLIQRVTKAEVRTYEKTVGRIGAGLLVFIGIRKDDEAAHVEKLANKLLRLRLFADENGKMNRNVQEVNGALLIVSQFTLYADTRHGNRPSFSSAERPEKAKSLYELFVSYCRLQGVAVETGVFQEHMVVDITNDGPVTVLCESDSGY